MCTILNHYRDFITLLFSSSTRYNCRQTITLILLTPQRPMDLQYPEPASLFAKAMVRSLTHLCLLKQSCGNQPSKSSLIALQWFCFQSCSNIWPAIRPFLTSHLPEMLGTAQCSFFACNFNLYMLFPWDIIILLKWKIISIYIRKTTLLQKMWKNCMINPL